MKTKKTDVNKPYIDVSKAYILERHFEPGELRRSGGWYERMVLPRHKSLRSAKKEKAELSPEERKLHRIVRILTIRDIM